MKKNKRVTQTKIKDFFLKIPFGLYIIFMLLLVASAIALVVFMVKDIFSLSAEEKSLYVQLLLGLAATVLSIIIALNGIVTMIINKIKNLKDDERQKTLSVTQFIAQFNEKYLLKVNKMRNIISMTIKSSKVEFDFKPSLSNQANKVEKIDKELKEKNIVLFDEYLYFCSGSSYSTDNCFSDDVHKLCEKIVSEKNNGGDISKYKQTIGGIEILRFYRKERIDILNFFENIAISYFNDNLNRVMVNAQFKHMLSKLIPSFYYFIYKDEGVDCYPYLNMMLKYMFEE